jgi:hypothetical protein
MLLASGCAFKQEKWVPVQAAPPEIPQLSNEARQLPAPQWTSDLFQRAVKRAGELVKAYCLSIIAGLACERSFNPLASVPK